MVMYADSCFFTLLLTQVCLHSHHQGEEIVVDREGPRVVLFLAFEPFYKRLIFVSLGSSAPEDGEVLLEMLAELRVLW